MGLRLDLSSVWAKFHRAEAHIDAFEAEVFSWINSKPYQVSKHHNTDCSRYWATVHVVNKLNLESLSLVVSDAIHNFRCALDHLIYAAAIFRTQRNPPPRAGYLGFPIRKNPASFQAAIKKMGIPQLGAAVEKEIERFQPYNRPHDVLPPLLGLIKGFDDADKHRMLNVNVAVQGGAGWEWNQPGWLPLPQQAFGMTEVIDGAKVGELTFMGPAEKADPKFTADIVISAFPPLKTKKPVEVPYMLPEMTREVRSIIEGIQGVVVHD